MLKATNSESLWRKAAVTLIVDQDDDGSVDSMLTAMLLDFTTLILLLQIAPVISVQELVVESSNCTSAGFSTD